MEAESVRLGFYGSYYDEQGFYVDGMISGAYHDYDSDRRVLMGSIIREAGASPEGVEFSLKVAMGYDWTI